MALTYSLPPWRLLGNPILLKNLSQDFWRGKGKAMTKMGSANPLGQR